MTRRRAGRSRLPPSRHANYGSRALHLARKASPILSALAALALGACEDEIITSSGSAAPQPPASGAASAARSSAPPASAAPKASPSAAPTASAAPEPPFDEQVKNSAPAKLSPAEQALGKAKITAEICDVEGGGFVGKSGFDLARGIKVLGSRVVVVDPTDKLRAFDVAKGPGCKLTVAKDFGDGGALAVEPKARALSAAKDVLLPSNGVFGSAYVKGGKALYKCEVRPQGYVSLHPQGAWGLGFFANASVTKLAFTDKECKGEPWFLTDLGSPEKRKGPLESVSAIGFVNDLVVVGGIVARETDSGAPRVAIALDATGKERFRMGSPDPHSNADDRLGWVHAVQPCKEGICLLDGNLRRISVWSKDGKNVGAVHLTKLLGVPVLWAQDFQIDKDGAWLIAAVPRDKVKVSDSVILRVKGL